MVHLQVIGRVFPYSWINGGGSTSYDVRVNVSLVGMIPLVVLGALTYLASSISKVRMGVRVKITLWLLALSYVLTQT